MSEQQQQTAAVERLIDQEGGAIKASGDWVLGAAKALDRDLRRIVDELTSAVGTAAPSSQTALRLNNITKIDTAGAWLAARTVRDLEDRGVEVSVVGDPQVRKLVERALMSAREPIHCTAPRHSTLSKIGHAVDDIGQEAWRLIVFLGEVVVTLLASLLRPWTIRWRSVAAHIEHAGVDAVPIVLLLSSLVGLVLAFQGGQELRRFGAELFTVDLLGISILRELGPLMTAIIIAGRSGSAFAAQIGTMKLNEEIDALRTIGLNPFEMLVIPRILALMLALPLIAFLANIAALLGGALVIVTVYGFPFTQIVGQFQLAVSTDILVAGLAKTPIFAFIIAIVGCRNGLQVSGGAASVGERTTRAVVASIFLVIVVNAVFSVIFSRFGL